MKILSIYVLEFVGFDGVEGRGVFILEDRRSPDDEMAFEGTDLKYNFMQDENCSFDNNDRSISAYSDDAFCHLVPSLTENSIFLDLVGSRSVLIDRRLILLLCGKSVIVILSSFKIFSSRVIDVIELVELIFRIFCDFCTPDDILFLVEFIDC